MECLTNPLKTITQCSLCMRTTKGMQVSLCRFLSYCDFNIAHCITNRATFGRSPRLGACKGMESINTMVWSEQIESIEREKILYYVDRLFYAQSNQSILSYQGRGLLCQ